MPKPTLISIPLDIPDVRVLQTELTKDGKLILTVESTLNSTTCRRCGRTITERHGVDEPRLLRHLPILGRVVYLRIRPKRFRCPWCEGIPPPRSNSTGMTRTLRTPKPTSASSYSSWSI